MEIGSDIQAVGDCRNKKGKGREGMGRKGRERKGKERKGKEKILQTRTKVLYFTPVLRRPQ